MDESVRLCFLGPHLGLRDGFVPSQGEILAANLKRCGYRVISASTLPNRFIRLADINLTLIRHRKQIDLVLAEVYGGRSFIVEDSLSFLCRIFKLPLILTLHGGAMPDFMGRFPNWTRRVLSRADVMTAPSYYLIEALTQYGFTLRLIPNTITLGDYPYRYRGTVQPRLFWMRSFHDIYYPEMAVQVLALVRKRFPQACLVMAGSNKGLEEKTKQLAHDLGVGDAVEFPGFLNMSGKAHYGSICDIFINTNRIDNMPVGVVEACAMGMPVVTTNVGGIPYLLTHEETGLLVDNEDIQAMSEAVIRLAETPQLAATLSKNGRKIAERSSWDQVRLQWEALFVEVLDRREA